MSRRAELALVALVMTALGLALWSGRRQAGARPELDFRTSTFVSGPAGSRAVYDVVARLRFPVDRWRTPLLDLASVTVGRPAVLLVLNPVIPLLPAELRQVVRFVRGGGAIVAAGRGGGVTSCAGWRAASAAGPFPADTIPVRPPRAGLTLPPVADVLDRPAARRQAGEDECHLLAPAAEDTLLVTRDGRPVVVRLRYAAGGRVTLVADAGYFRNRAWRLGNAPYFLVPLVAPGRTGPITWDEYHQGFGEGPSLAGVTLGWLTGSPVGWALLQLVAVLVIALAVQAVRFGPARSVIERRRRSPLEHVEALAAGLEGAAGWDTAVRLMVAGLWRRLSRTGLAAPGERAEPLDALALAVRSERGRQAVRRLEQLERTPGGAERVLDAAQSVEDVWEELRPRTTRGGS